MNKENLRNKIMANLSESLNEAKAFDPKNNKDHREAYNSFVKWYNRWKEKLGREEIRGLVRKVTNDALGDNLDRINEARIPGAADEHLAEDIALRFDNTGYLWQQYAEWVTNCLLKRLRRGQAVLEDYLANASIIDEALRATIKDYQKEYPNLYVSSDTRKLARQKITHLIYTHAMDEWEYEQNNN